jgi:penicillin G amidase
MILEAKVGGDFKYYDWGLGTTALENMVNHRLARWLPSGFGSYDELLAAAVEATVKDAPRDLRSWKWGEVFALEIQHPLFGNIPVLNWFTGTGRHPQSGGGYTVKQIGRTFGPSERMTVDFSRLDASTLNIVVGQSGNWLSPYYKDQFAAWYGDKTFVLPFSDVGVANAKQHELTMKPQK